jgi:hypothetical protein
MVRKTCEQCGNEAVVTVCWLVSTVGVSPRAQKCSKGTVLCASCLCRLLEAEGSALPLLLRQRLSEAYTAALRRFSGLFHSQSITSVDSIPNQVEVSQ